MFLKGQELTKVQKSHVEKSSWNNLRTDGVVGGNILHWLRQFPSGPDVTYALKWTTSQCHSEMKKAALLQNMLSTSRMKYA